MIRIIFMAALLVAACSDDSASDNPVNNTATNNTATNNTNNTATNNTATNNTATNNTATNNTVADMGESDAEQDMAPEDMAPEDMAIDLNEQPCAHPATDPQCPPKDFGAASMMTTLEILPDNSCCFDFGGAAGIDNRLGTLLSAAESFGFDVNMGISRALRFGHVIYAFEFSGLSNIVYANNFRLAFYTARDADLDFESNYLGLGEVYILADAVSTQTPPTPKWSFTTTSVRDGQLVASDGFLRLDFPGLLDEVRINVTQARLSAHIDDADLVGGGTVTLSEGKLGGVVLRDDFFNSLNEASSACECLSRDVYIRNTSGTYSCISTASDEANCRTSPVAGCRFLASSTNCGQLGGLSSLTDIDTNNDGTKDGYSFGATFTTVGTKILGIDPF